MFLKYANITGATLFGIGYLPAPGTMASLATVVLWYFFLSDLSLTVQAILLVVSFPIFTIICSVAENSINQKDPSIVVIDEFFGIWLAVLFTTDSLVLIGIQFILFRILDISKAGPVGWCDRNVRGGFGIMLDDLVAGLLCMPVGYLLSSYYPNADEWAMKAISLL